VSSLKELQRFQLAKAGIKKALIDLSTGAFLVIGYFIKLLL